MQGEVDTEDAFLSSIFALSAGAAVGIADVSMFGFSLADTGFTMGGTTISIGAMLAAGALAAAYLTNEPNLDTLEDEYRYAVFGTVALVVAIPLVPSLNQFVTSNDFIALAAVSVQSAGFMAVSYLA